MTRHLRLPGMGLVLPELLARVQIEAVDQPVVNPLGRIADALALIQPFVGRDVLFVADDRRQEDPIAPDDRTGPPPARHISHPLDVLSRRPPGRQARVIRGHAIGVRAAEPGPVVSRGSGGGKTNDCQKSE